MAALPPERSGDLLQLFTAAYTSYRDHPHTGGMIGDGDLSSLVLRFWRRLPPNLVHDAISELLKQAAGVKDSTVSMSSDKGSATFGSYYNYRLFQLVPVLRQIDESEADELLKKNQELQGMLTKYPEGAASISPEMAEPAPKPDKQGKKGSGTSFSISSGGSAGGGMMTQALEDQQARKIAAEADSHPDTALAQAGSVSSLPMRANLYLDIARAAAKKSPSTARSALDKLLDLTAQLEERNPTQVSLLRSAADLYLQMGESDSARKVIERGFAVAEKLLKGDSNADDPNKALKAFWPSAEAYRSFTRLAGQISPVWALTLLKEIEDPEMKVVVETALAQSWLDVSAGTTIVVSNRKHDNWMMISGDSPR